MAEQSGFAVVCTVQGELQASVVKSRLESEGIPAFLEYESVGRVYGLTVDGLGEVRVKVPVDLVEEARRVLEPNEEE
jgi:hypothetical protein